MTRELLVAQLQQALRVAKFKVLGSNVEVNAMGLSAMYFQQAGLNRLYITHARIHIDEAELEELMNAIRVVFEAYLDSESDEIGNGIFILLGGFPTISVKRFAENTLRAAAILGLPEATDKIFKWADGLPLQYKQEALVNFSRPPNDKGIVRVKEGIEIAKPASVNTEIIQKIPPMIAESLNANSLLFHSVLRVACEWKPVFVCAPKVNQPSLYQNAEMHWNQGKFSVTIDMIEKICQAMAVTMGQPVSWSFQWTNFQADEIFFAVMLDSDERPTYVKEKCPFPTEEDIVKTLNFYEQRQDAERKVSNLKYAIERLCGSQQAFTLEDQAIQLRIALETLFLSGEKAAGELRFRLALHAARDIGATRAEREKWFKVAKEAYDLGSGAVHGSVIRHRDRRQIEQIIAEGQKLCIEGIKKRVKEQRNPDWKEVLLS